jgi:hypothetical protein
MHEYIEKQEEEELCNLVDNENLRAVLRNENLDFYMAECYVFDLVKHSKTDNGQAASILFEDGRCEFSIYELQESLRKGFTAMAVVLLHDERMKKDVQMFHPCSDGIGCYECANKD